MPTLEEMYCSEQICIPPTFPYLLRQYAKAAIRSQPSDLLKWSTAYFRCLSLNVPPPVKPRLEYPIPRDFNGITPGWLKALLVQLGTNRTITFKVLWDRWMGACLQHQTLIQLLCLGGFEDVENVQWLRFIAICAATLTDDLSHSMILLCEILTEEPEGGSAMITLEIFLDLYKFLAKIDASRGQTLRNYYFRDSLLDLWGQRSEKDETLELHKEASVEEIEESVASKSTTETLDEDKGDMDKVVSCPSLPDDDQYSVDYLLKQQRDTEEEEEEEEEGEGMKILTTLHEEEEVTMKKSMDLKNEDQEHLDEDELKEEELEEAGEDKAETQKQVEEPQIELDEIQDAEVTDSKDTILDQPIRNIENAFDDDRTLQEDLQRLKALQLEMAGETDDELEKFKCGLIADMPISESQEKGIKDFQMDVPTKEMMHSTIQAKETSAVDVDDEEGDDRDNKRSYDVIYVEAIPGIAGTVPDNVIKAVEDYMKGCAKNQHGMVMPRNIRHYSCPPLEMLDY